MGPVAPWLPPGERLHRRATGSDSAVKHPVVRELLKKTPLNEVLLHRLTEVEEQAAAFNLLFREMSLDVLNQCLDRVLDEELAAFLLDSVLLIAAVLSSEALASIEQRQAALRALGEALPEDAATARKLYDYEIEQLGSSVFALGRRLLTIEQGLAGCPFSGNADTQRGLYGQRARDLAGSLGFLRADLARWARRAVPLEKQLPEGAEGRRFLEARLSSVVDDLGLRIREVRESLGSALFDQLVVFQPALTRKQVFKRDLENVVELDSLLEKLAELIRLVQHYDQKREPAALEQVKAELSGFRPERFPALSGIRESDQQLLANAAANMAKLQSQGSVTDADASGPAHLLLLLLGDLFRNLKQRQTPRLVTQAD